LITKVTEDPKIITLNPDKQFELETDASNFALEAILFPCNKRGKWRAVGYASRTLTAPKRNYDIWDKEFLGLIFRLIKWWHYLMCTKEPVLAFVNHANLAYYRHPQKINQQVTYYISTLANYNLKIIHKSEALNHTDALSRWPNYDNGKDDNTNTTALPDDLFIKHINSLTLYEKVAMEQYGQKGEQIKNWATQHTLNLNNHH